jgi:hypothetical protein
LKDLSSRLSRYIQASSRIDWLWLLLVGTLSTLLILRVGNVGIQFEDLSIAIDGGFRLLKGQLPFVDFMSPFGPVLYLQQALFFALLGVSYQAFLAHAVVINLAAVFIIYLIFRPIDRMTALFAASLTGFWFYPPVGAPYVDNTTIFWALVSIYFVFRSLQDKRETTWLILSGLVVGLAILTKQNLGGLAALGILAFIYYEKRQLRSLFNFLVGLLVPMGLFFLYLLLNQATADFWHYAVRVHMETGRLLGALPQILNRVWNSFGPESQLSVDYSLWLAEAVLLLVILMVLGRAIEARDTDRKRLTFLSAILIPGHYLFARMSFNDWPIYLSFVGLTAGSLTFTIAPKRWRSIAQLMLLPILIFLGYHISVTRVVHGLPPADMTYALQAPRLEGVAVEPEIGVDLDDLLRYLDREVSEGEQIFYFGNRALVHAVLDRPSPQPLMWFREGVTFSELDPHRSDQLLLGTIIEEDIEWIVIEDDEVLRPFPETRNFILQNYEQVREVGSRAYFVYRRIDSMN